MWGGQENYSETQNRPDSYLQRGKSCATGALINRLLEILVLGRLATANGGERCKGKEKNARPIETREEKSSLAGAAKTRG